VRTLIVLIAGAAIGLAAWIVVGSPFAKRPVTKAGIERAVTKRTSGQVQLTLCNEEVVPSRTPHPASQHTWTCDTYLGPNPADAQNGPSYKVIVDDGSIQSIRRVPTH
jgi:Na+/glutamate symporter